MNQPSGAHTTRMRLPGSLQVELFAVHSALPNGWDGIGTGVAVGTNGVGVGGFGVGVGAAVVGVAVGASVVGVGVALPWVGVEAGVPGVDVGPGEALPAGLGLEPGLALAVAPGDGELPGDPTAMTVEGLVVGVAVALGAAAWESPPPPRVSSTAPPRTAIRRSTATPTIARMRVGAAPSPSAGGRSRSTPAVRRGR